MNQFQLAGVGTLLLGSLALAPCAQVAATGRDHPRVVAGTFDSRAILMAYVRSEAYREYVGEQQRDVARAIDRARAFGDEALARDLDALGTAVQRRTHEQGFGTAPVDEILARIQGELPGIAREAGVDVIVSKWNLTYLRPGTELVDVTEPLVRLFDPNEETLKGIRELVRVAPVPHDQLEDDH